MSSLPPEELLYQLGHVGQNRGPGIVVTVAVFGALAVLCLLTRLVHRFKTNGICIDDYLMLLAAIPTFGTVLASLMMVHYGVGLHAVAIQPANAVPMAKWSIVLLYTFPAAISLVKLSVLAFIARVFTMQDRLIRVGVWVMSIYTILWLAGNYLGFSLACRPFSKLWTTQSTTCYLFETSTIAITVLNIVGDLALIVLPQPRIARLDLPLRRRIGIGMIMALGVFCAIMGVVRIARSVNLNPYDSTYDTNTTIIFTVLEPLVGIIAGCLPSTYHLALMTFSSKSPSNNLPTSRTTRTASPAPSIGAKHELCRRIAPTFQTWQIDRSKSGESDFEFDDHAVSPSSPDLEKGSSSPGGWRELRASLGEIRKTTTISVTLDDEKGL